MASIALIPNAAGDETAIPTLVGAATHWEACVSKDDDTSYVASSGAAFTRDLYNLEDTAGITQAITKVAVRAYVRGSVAGTGTAKTAIKTNGVVYDGVAKDVGTAYAVIETEYATNPQTGLAWTWTQINALQAGISLKRPAANQTTRCTYVLVIVYFAIGTQTFYPITPVEVTPGTASAWTDVDVSAYVPTGATGVIIHFVNTYTLGVKAIGLRKNGSTDNRYESLSDSGHTWAVIGVDASRIFETYVGDITYVDVYLVGYTVAGATFFTNAYDKSMTTLTTWEDINCASVAPSAIGLIWEVNVATGTGYAFGMRMNGSNDARVSVTSRHKTFGVIIGCDASQLVEGYIGNGYIDFFLVGYITDGCTFNINATDISFDTPLATWTDLTPLPANSVIGFIEVSVGTTAYKYGLRKNGGNEELYYYAYCHPWAFVECDANYIIEGKIANAAVDFFVVGYATAAAVAAPRSFGYIIG